MRPGGLSLTLAFVVVAAVLQTTLFGDGRLQPFGASPALVTLIVIATVRFLEPDQALLVAFTAGLLMDLLGASPLGLWAMAMTKRAVPSLAGHTATTAPTGSGGSWLTRIG